MTKIDPRLSLDQPLPWGQVLVAGIPGCQVDPVVEHLLMDLKVGGIILFRRNLGSPRQVAQLTRDLQKLSLAATGSSLLIAIDQEGGPVQRLQSPFTQMPAAQELGQQDNPRAVESLATRLARELRLVGINMNLAPVLDVARGPDSPLWERSYGAEPDKVARLGLAALRGFWAGGVIPVAKHFPGLGHTTLDSHRDTPTVQGEARDRQQDLFPFRQAVAAGAPVIMSAHVLVPGWDKQPATLSRKILTERLRGQLGFQGLIITDDLEMGGITQYCPLAQAAPQALAAGADLLLICEHQEAITQAHTALANSTGLDMRLRESLQRIQHLKQRFPYTPIDPEAVQAYFNAAGGKD
ncbi:MAG: beta-N-acetylhexosaminidase [Desulfobacteraceae bacterium]